LGIGILVISFQVGYVGGVIINGIFVCVVPWSTLTFPLFRNLMRLKKREKNIEIFGRYVFWIFQFLYHRYFRIFLSQILREINFEECRSSKTAIFAILVPLNFVNLVNFSLLKVQKFIRLKIQSLSICLNGRF